MDVWNLIAERKIREAIEGALFHGLADLAFGDEVPDIHTFSLAQNAGISRKAGEGIWPTDGHGYTRMEDKAHLCRKGWAKGVAAAGGLSDLSPGVFPAASGLSCTLRRRRHWAA